MNDDENDYDRIATRIEKTILNLIGSTYLREHPDELTSEVNIGKFYDCLEQLQITAKWARGLSESHKLAIDDMERE